ncbi:MULTISPECIES: flagellar basal body-associated FliL family protein [Thioclava]|uniref:Flagellar protein FliL n=1 Tax=Thioclava nitratireducens TaxID=1915078 RepID=A0ABM6ICZ4_9RHOB|nr:MULTISPECIES: flagellar basal body-associated FliL family protein [Thioclava]AQS46574.1 flagellar basal body-associated protein FliL [Thioclava nitratireducens]OWY02281.1 flagellar basal body-associated protein FliL [Thioclava sp. IC9]OWY02621.1 flagellar basal body-associated protein FliL [Thioclava sp. F1Mire-8]OWY08283.1 flagellar basal body-associated protein FliL [Thioclava sp. F42-5]OWY16477.1 flagellar basal body-associated protein FliL [Thioclava sp. JM3]
MLGKLLPLLLGLIGLAGGGAAGYFLRPAPPPAAPPTAPAAAEAEAGKSAAATDSHGDPVAVANGAGGEVTSEFVKLNNQFIVPLVTESHISGMVILSLSLEVKAGETEAVYRAEPKLRDAFLQVLFDHANTGGFQGLFTDSANMSRLRRALTETARNILGPSVLAVLVSDIVRQDS